MARPLNRERAVSREHFVLSCIGVVGFFAAWQAISASGLVSARYLPGPLTVLSTVVELTTQPYSGATLWGHLSASLVRFGLGFLLVLVLVLRATLDHRMRSSMVSSFLPRPRIRTASGPRIWE